MVANMLKNARDNQGVAQELEKMNKQFTFSVTGKDSFSLVLKPGEVSLVDGVVPSPAATVSASEEVLNDVFSGKLDAVKAFMSGQLKVSGDIFAAQRLTELAKKAGK